MNIDGSVNGAEWEITSILGKRELKGNISNSSAKLDISGLKPGVYLFTVSNGGYKETRKFIKD